MTLDWSAVGDYACAIAFGGLVAIGELASRYRDSPARALQSRPGLLYIGINGAAAGFALMLIHTFHWTLSASPDHAAIRWTQILTAGFGSIAFFRTSLFTVRAGDHDVAVGPSTFLQIVLRASDSAVDRLQAKERSDIVTEVMGKVSFAHSNAALPAFCLALMQNVAAEDQKRLADKVLQIASAQVEDKVRSLMLGLALLDLVGDDVLETAAKALRDLIQNPKANAGADAANAPAAGAGGVANPPPAPAVVVANAPPNAAAEGAANPAMPIGNGGDPPPAVGNPPPAGADKP
jgi:hypothetical protein